MVTYVKLLPEFKLSYGIESGKVESEAVAGQAKALSGPVGPVVDYKDYAAAIKKIDTIEEKVEFVAAEIQQSAGVTLGREVGILYGFLFGALIYITYSLLVILKVI